MPDFEENISRHFHFDPESQDDCAAVLDLSNMVLCFELLLMAKLNYDLIIHSPLKPLEGFILDMRTRCPDLRDPDGLRMGALRFITESMISDCLLLFTPSQIALTALIFSAGPGKDHAVHQYIKEVLCLGSSENDLAALNQAIEGKAKYLFNMSLTSYSTDCTSVVTSSKAEWALSFIEENEQSMPVDNATFNHWIESTIDDLLERLKHCRNPANDYLTEQFSKRFNDTNFSDDE